MVRSRPWSRLAVLAAVVLLVVVAPDRARAQDAVVVLVQPPAEFGVAAGTSATLCSAVAFHLPGADVVEAFTANETCSMNGVEGACTPLTATFDPAVSGHALAGFPLCLPFTQCAAPGPCPDLHYELDVTLRYASGGVSPSAHWAFDVRDGAASADPPAGQRAHGVRTVFKGSFSNEPDQIDYIANVDDLQIPNGVGASKVAALHEASPSTVVYMYEKLGGIHGPDDIAPEGDPGWDKVKEQDLIWYGPSGEPAMHTQNGWFYIDIVDPAKRAAWVSILVEEINVQIGNGYDAIFLDNACVIDASLITEFPASYTDTDYFLAVREVLIALRAAFPDRRILINSYMGAAAPGTRGLALLPHVDGLFFEGFSMKASSNYFAERSRYRQQLYDFAAVVMAGKMGIAMDYAPVGDMERRMWSLASYLLVNSPTSYHYYAGTDAGSDLQSYPEKTLDLGHALAPASDRTDELITRPYQGGTVIVNPSDSEKSYALGGGTWQRMGLEGGGAFPAAGSITWSPIDGTTLVLPPDTAAIVRAAPATASP